MDYMKMKLAIYESYGNGEMTSEACSHLIDHLDEKYGESIAEEAANAENEFIHASLNVFTESAGEEALTEAAKSFGEKMKAAWEKFKNWIKKIIEKVRSRIGLKAGKDKVKVHKDLSKSLGKASESVKKLSTAKDKASLVAAVAGVGAATAAIIKCKSLKNSNDTLMRERDDVQKECAKKLEEIQQAMDSLQKRYDNLSKTNDENVGSLSDELKKLREENEKLKSAQEELRKLKNDKSNSDVNISNRIKTAEREIDSITKNITDLQNRVNKNIPNDTSYNSEYSKIIKCINDLVGSISSISASVESMKQFMPEGASNSESIIFARAKTIIDSHNKKRLPYIFADAGLFEVDPDYRLHKRAYEYLVKTWPNGFDDYKEMTPLKENPNDLTSDEFVHILLDIKENFAKKRMDYLIKAAPIVKADRLKRLYGDK